MITTLLILWNLLWLVNTEINNEDICQPCSCSIEMGTRLFDCSQRALQNTSDEWPKEFSQLNADLDIMLMYNENDIQLVKQFPSLQAKKIMINIQNNKISEIEESAFSDIENLQYLDLSHNQLTGDAIREETFRGKFKMRNYMDLSLETLNVAHNSIHSLDRKAFAHTPNLTQLFIQHNPFKILDSVTILALSTLNNLEILDMSYIGINNIPDGTFRHFSKLQKLNLSGNQLKTVPLAIGEVAHSLQFLMLNSNLMEELDDESFLGLRKLKILELSENDALLQVKSNTFAQLTNLKILHLCHNSKLNYISHTAFARTYANWTLKEVYLDENKLSSLASDLLPWGNLHVLSLSGNIWQCDCDFMSTILKEGVLSKIPQKKTPRCMTPIKMSGRTFYDTFDNCIDFIDDASIDVKWPRKFKFKPFKVGYLIWSIVTVFIFIMIGTALGLGIKYIKKYISNFQRPQIIRYTNVNEETV